MIEASTQISSNDHIRTRGWLQVDCEALRIVGNQVKIGRISKRPEQVTVSIYQWSVLSFETHMPFPRNRGSPGGVPENSIIEWEDISRQAKWGALIDQDQCDRGPKIDLPLLDVETWDLGLFGFLLLQTKWPGKSRAESFDIG